MKSLPLTAPRLPWLAALWLCGGCVGTGSDGDDEVRLDIDLFWEEVGEGGDGSETCLSARVDYTMWKLLDSEGEVVDCHPRDADGACLDTPEESCDDQIRTTVLPGEYSLLLDGYRTGCRTPQWHAVCDSIFLDRFDEQYACVIDGADDCEPGTPGQPPDEGDAGI